MPDSDLRLTFLQLIQRCDNASISRSIIDSDIPSEFDDEELVPLYLSPSSTSKDYQIAIGLLRPIVVERLKAENEQNKKENQKELWAFNVDKTTSKSRISFADWANRPSIRTAAMKELCERWRDSGLFSDVCGPKKWRAELYPVYRDPFGPHDYPKDGSDSSENNFAFDMERSACAIFGVVTYGVHMTIYQEIGTNTSRELKIWVPTRARTKPTWPGYFDNTVAGGIPSGMGMFESLVKECMEEASLAADVVHKYARCVGSISYFFRTSSGWLQPEIEYVYDMPIPPDKDPTLFTPKPLDREVECFELLDQTAVTDRMRAGKFKANCALVIIDLFIRLGYITPDNEPEYMKIITRLHGRFEYERW
ncbi:nudix hydrolase 20 [Lentinula aciculospora]|uniref:Nudix hydrolase 20 n=1 Tax=Lentinula aciculospora TaxID=153920 RepID=A0A9W9AWF0_9AGAR|nr:nudix hydrolase 20 [Lentinula aciculospora]